MNKVEGLIQDFLFLAISRSHEKCNAVSGCVPFYENSEPLGEDANRPLPVVLCLSFSQAYLAPQK